MSEYILQMEHITKIYENGFIANKDVNLEIKKGEIHALVGENGAGKTTLMNILFGLLPYQEGTIRIDGEEVKIQSPLDAIAHGVGMVHQHFMQMPSLTVAENVTLGIEPSRHGVLFDSKEAEKITQEVSERYNLKVNASDIVGDLSVGLRQKVELLKALVRQCRLLILDEPTAVLTPQETAELFVQLKALKNDGFSIIFISHKLEEVMELCDRVTVLRRGRTVGTDEVRNLTSAMISRMMVGRDVIMKMEKDGKDTKDVVLRVDNVHYLNQDNVSVVNGVSFEVRAGEILGIAGVEGNGQNEIAEMVAGVAEPVFGNVTINGVSNKGQNTMQIRSKGVAYISDDRMRFGCAPNLSVAENIMAGRIHRKDYRRMNLFTDVRRVSDEVDELIKEFEIKCDSRNEAVRMLSGGNIQKVIVAREFSSGANLIVANQPTRGIDVGTTEMIRKTLIRKTREENVAVLLVSSDLNEVLEVSDRLLVMKDGKIVAHFPDAQKVGEEELGEYMLGVRSMTEEEMGVTV